MSQGKDYYAILGVPRDAHPEQIKSAYRKAAVRYHPDKNPGDKEAEDMFKRVSEAYAVLGDAEKRSRYDRYGEAGVEGAGGIPWDSAVFEGFEDLFGSLFGFGDLFGGRGRGRRPSRGSDLRLDLAVTLEEAFEGKEAKVEIPRMEACSECGGSGSRSGNRSVCSACHGRGTVAFQQGFFTVSRTCPQCAGEGETVRDPCARCRGTGQVSGKKTLNIKIPPGVDSGARLRVSGEGEAGSRGGARGDLYIFIDVEPHPFFERTSEHLLCRVPLSFPEIALGTELTLNTLDGEEHLKIPPSTEVGKRFRLAGRGMPRLGRSGRGDLFVEVNVATPKNLTKEEKGLYKELLRLQRDREEKGGGFFSKLFSR